VSYAQTYDNLCVLLEEYRDSDVETVAGQIMGLLGILGEDNLDAFDPPPGLVHWLLSHGLSLVTTTEARSPRVWEALEEDEDGGEEEDEGSLEGDGENLPLQAGEYIEYRTAPQGRDHVQQIGAGYVLEVLDYGIWVRVPGLEHPVFVDPEGDFTRRVPEQNAPALPE
jgi:hypothetical protein